jgi:aminomethyltransferase
MTTEPAAPVALLETALVDRHLAANARMVEFGGWRMPIQYRGILAEHQAVRSAVGVFDLSHMGRLYVRGRDAHALVQMLATNDVLKLAPGRAQYSLFCGADGRILDDIVVYNLGEQVLVVVNASNRDKLLRWIADQVRGAAAGLDAELHDSTRETVMIGFQGPQAELALQPLVDAPLADLRYYAALRARVAGFDGLVARTGYTGEDGFELIVAADDGPALWDALLMGQAGVTPTPCGLGARDTLRLEAGMALYGHEIDEQTNPYEAGLGRVVKLDKGPFVARDALRAIADRGVERRLVGFELVEGGVPRQDYPILDRGRRVGRVTSGNVSPSLGKPIGMGYVPTELAEPGQSIAVEIRGRAAAASVVALPFYQHRTKRIGRPTAAPVQPGG